MATGEVKVSELSALSSVPDNAQIMVTHDGGSYRVSKKNFLKSLIGNSLIVSAGFTVEEDEVTFNAAYQWIIAGDLYGNASAVVITVPMAAAGMQRIDLFVGNTAGMIVRVPGDESEDNPFAPEVPDDTVAITFVTVDDTEVVGEDPISVGDFVKKAESRVKSLVSYSPGLVIDNFPITDRCNYDIAQNGSNTVVEIKGFEFGSSFEKYPGQMFTIRNIQSVDVIFKHDDAAADQKMFLLNGTDFVLKPTDSIVFRLNSTMQKFEQIGVAVLDIDDIDFQTVTGNGDTTTEIIGVGTEVISSTVRAMQVGDGVADGTNNVLMVTKQITTNANTNALNVRLNVIANGNASARVSRAIKSKAYLDPNGFTLSNTGGACMAIEGVAYATGSNGGTIDVLTAIYSRIINESTNVNCGYLIGIYVNTNNGPALRSIGIMILDLTTQNADSDFYTHLLMGVDNHLYTPAGNYMIYSPKDWPSYMRGKLGINVIVPTEAIDVDGNIKATGNVIISTAPTTGTHATNKTYVDGLIATKANDSDVVKLTGAQSVAGEKTFANDIIAAVIKNSIPTRGAISMGDISNPGANTRNTTGSMAAWATTNSNSGSTGDIHVFRSNVGGTIADRAGIRKDGRVYGVDGTAANDFVTLAQVSKQLKDFYTDVSNSTTTETDLYSYTIPANTLNAVGQKIVFKHSGIANNAGGVKGVWRNRLGGTAVFESIDGGAGIPLIVNGVYRCETTIIRIDSDSVRVTTDFFFGKLGTAGYTVANYLQVDSLTFSSTIILKCTVQTDGTTGDVTAKMGNIKFEPAAP